MAEIHLKLVSYIYVSTRLRVRKASLFPLPVYRNPEIVLFLMQHGYGTRMAEHVRQEASPSSSKRCSSSTSARPTRPSFGSRRGNCGT